MLSFEVQFTHIWVVLNCSYAGFLTSFELSIASRPSCHVLWFFCVPPCCLLMWATSLLVGYDDFFAEILAPKSRSHLVFTRIPEFREEVLFQVPLREFRTTHHHVMACG